MQRKLARAARHGGSPITLEDRAAAQRCVARHCRLHGDAHAHCLRVPIQKRSHDSFAHGNGRVLRRKTGVNDEEGRLEPAEVDQVSRALRPMAATHLALTSPEHLFEVEPSLCPLLTLTAHLGARIQHSAGLLASGGCKWMAARGCGSFTLA